MHYSIFLFVCIAAVTAETIHFQQQTNSLDGQWSIYKSVFRKKYLTLQHEASRRFIWEENMRYINMHNSEADLGIHTYWLGMNEYGDLSNDEYQQFLLRRQRKRPSLSSGSVFLTPSNIRLPPQVDWRKHGYVTPVKNQGQMGASWTFSATGSLEGQQFKKTGKLVPLSEQNLYDCVKRPWVGEMVDRAFEYCKENGGVDTEAGYPKEGKPGQCRFKKSAVGVTCTGYVDLPRGNETQLQAAVASVGPISIIIDAGHPSFQLYRGGVYDEPHCSPTNLDHAALVVGYGTSDGKDYWIVKNSWGSSWGIGGYIKMSRNKANQCGIASLASYPLV